MAQYNKAEIVKALREKMSVSDICSKFSLSRSSVFVIKKRLKVTGTIDTNVGRGRPVSKVTPAFTTELMAKFRVRII